MAGPQTTCASDAYTAASTGPDSGASKSCLAARGAARAGARLHPLAQPGLAAGPAAGQLVALGVSPGVALLGRAPRLAGGVVRQLRRPLYRALWYAVCAAQRSAVRRAQAGSPAAEGVWACSCGVGGPSSTASAPACAGHLPHVLPLRSQRTSWSNSGSALAQRQTDRSGACRQARLPRKITPILCKSVCITQCIGGGLASHSVHRPVPLP